VRGLLAIVIFAVSFGYVEAAVVVYLRSLYEPLHQRLYPKRAQGDLFPFLPLEHLAAPIADHPNLAHIELVREGATLLMLAAATLGVSRNYRQGLAAFALAFGLWDICYYVFLAVLTGWPNSLFDWDLLFLLPVPWTAPVLAPVLVALTLVVTGILVLHREAAGRPVHFSWLHGLGLLVAGLVVVVSFCLDFPSVQAGWLPESFPWWLFAIGLGTGIATFVHAWRTGKVDHG
jgi:hypothetical protein